MNSFRKFVMGFLLGLGITYWYLHQAESTQKDTTAWFGGASSNYRGDSRRQAADSIK